MLDLKAISSKPRHTSIEDTSKAKSSSLTPRPTKLTCHICGEVGHLRANCPTLNNISSSSFNVDLEMDNSFANSPKR